MIKQKILVLGGAGYLGQEISRRFETESDFLITAGDLVDPMNSGIAFEKVDVLDDTSLDEQVKNHDIIINCTGQVTQPIHACFIINTEGMTNILDAVNKHNKKLFHISTVGVYGTKEYVDEQSALNPESPYSACKAFAEFQVMKTLGSKSCILRLPNLYGENQKKGLFSYLIRSYRSDKKLYFNNDGSLSRYFLHVSDCADAVLLAVKKDLSGVFNVPATEKYSLTEIIEIVEKIKSVKFETVYEQTPPVENINIINFKAFADVTGFLPKQSLYAFINHSFLLP